MFSILSPLEFTGLELAAGMHVFRDEFLIREAFLRPLRRMPRCFNRLPQSWPTIRRRVERAAPMPDRRLKIISGAAEH